MFPGTVRMKERRKENRKLIRGIARSAVALMGAILLLSVTVLDGGNTFFSSAAGPKISAEPTGGERNITTGATIKLVCWATNSYYAKQAGVKNAADLYEKDGYGLFMWENGGNYYYSAYNEFDSSGFRWIGRNIDTNPYISTGDSFYTRDFIGAPYFHYGGKDGDSKTSKYKIEFQNKDNKLEGYYLYCDGDDIYRRKSGDNWTISSPVIGSASFGTYRVYYNRSAWWDTQLVIRGNKISSVEDTGDLFKIYRAWEQTFGAISNYTIGKGQVQRINNDVYQLDGTKLVIEDGAVLNVCGKFFYNGEIEVRGTLIVQDGGLMIPFSPTKEAGKITLKDGGTIIVKPNARLVAGLGKGQLNTTTNSLVNVESGNIINYGLVDICRIKLGSAATIENHSGGRMFLGYGISGGVGKFQGDYTSSTSASTLGLNLNYGSVNSTAGATIKCYSGSGLSVGNCGSGGQPCTVMSYDKDGIVFTSGYLKNNY